jgi:hypothetical protein
MIKKQTLTLQEKLDQEYLRAYINSFLSPEYDDTLSLEDDSYFEKIYGKENWANRCEERKKKDEEEKRRLD